MLRIDMDEFFFWLASHSNDEIVGLPGRYFHSPLARFLSDQAGYVAGEDGRRYGRATMEPYCWLELPRWAQVFAHLSERFLGKPLTAYEAVGVLVQVETLLTPVLVASCA